MEKKEKREGKEREKRRCRWRGEVMLTALCKMYPNSMTSDDVLLYRPASVYECSSNVFTFLRTNSSTIHTSTQIMLALSYSLPSILALLSPSQPYPLSLAVPLLTRSPVHVPIVMVSAWFLLLYCFLITSLSSFSKLIAN